ncbi:MAG TPA: pyridoxamine 5'-phosphate oxidase family protein, partial [Actinomycetota bacterium]|nr:pyridoxamine 5'-phosphate oxidase family protein [Actinomycetota bacterium]
MEWRILRLGIKRTKEDEMSIPESHRDILDHPKSFAHWATVGPDGAPQVNPVWFEFDGEQLVISQTKT